MSKIKLFIAGKNNIACDILSEAIEKYPNIDIYAIKNKTDNGIDNWQRSFAKHAETLKVPVCNLDEAYNHENAVFLSLEFDKIVKPEKFKTTKLYNIHFSLLPAYKGMYTSALPILHNSEKTGVTLHKIDCGIDTGEIIDQTIISIKEDMTCAELYNDYLKQGTKLVNKWLNEIITSTPKSKEQNKIGSTYFSKKEINYNETNIDSKKTAHQIKKQIQAYNHRHYQLPKFNNQEIVKAHITNEPSHTSPGSILEDTDLYTKIATIDYNIILHKDKLHSTIEHCKKDEVEQVKKLINNISYIDEKNEFGWSPLIVAAYYNSHKSIKILIEHGANPNDKNPKGTTVLMYAKDGALKTKDLTGFNHIRRAGADINAKDYAGKSLRDYITNEQAKFLEI